MSIVLQIAPLDLDRRRCRQPDVERRALRDDGWSPIAGHHGRRAGARARRAADDGALAAPKDAADS